LNDLVSIVLTLVLSALFSGIEIAFLTSNKLKIEIEKGQGKLSGKILSYFVKYPSRLIAAMLVGSNIMLVIYGIVIANLLTPFLNVYLGYSEYLVLLVQTLIATVIILLFGEFIPKILFRLNANNILNFLAVPVIILYYLLYPLVYIFIWSAEWVIKNVFHIRISEQEYVFTIIDLDDYLRYFIPEERESDDVQQEIQMFQNAMEFRNVRLRECMVPRTEILAVEENDSLERLLEMFISSEYSRILVYRETIDNIVGFVHSFDMFRSPDSITKVMKPIFYVPESMMASYALNMFIQNHRSLAVVVDEFGGTSGIVTIEDVMEEIFGEIEDEFDSGDLVEQKISDKEYLFSARLEIDYLNEKYNLRLPESEEYKTLAGLIIHYYERIPDLNEKIIIEHFQFDIVEVAENRIEMARLVIAEEREESTKVR